MMMATCKGGSVRSDPSVAVAAAFDIDQSQEAFPSERPPVRIAIKSKPDAQPYVR
jgi:hypothetical protein